MKEKEKRRALGRGLGALIPTGQPYGIDRERPVDVFFGGSTPSIEGEGLPRVADAADGRQHLSLIHI